VIGWLRGRVVEHEPDGGLILDVGGVGYEIVSPIGTLERLEPDDEGQLALYVHTHVREDALVLYGFASRDERMAFRTLIGISKVGPKLALAVLSVMSVGELAQLVASGAAPRLTRVPGIGKKTAERIVLELEGKLNARAFEAPAAAKAAAPAARPARGQARILLETLVHMGFKQAETERAIAALPSLEHPLNELIREALAILAP